MKPHNGRLVILTPGKPQPLSEIPRTVRNLTIAALTANTTSVHVGGKDVRARAGEANGLPLNGGTRPDTYTCPYPEVDLSTIWVDAITASEGVSFFGWVE